MPVSPEAAATSGSPAVDTSSVICSVNFLSGYHSVSRASSQESYPASGRTSPNSCRTTTASQTVDRSGVSRGRVWFTCAGSALPVCVCFATVTCDGPRSDRKVSVSTRRCLEPVPRAAIAVPIVTDYEVIMAGVRAMLGPHRHRVDVIELDIEQGEHALDGSFRASTRIDAQGSVFAGGVVGPGQPLPSRTRI